MESQILSVNIDIIKKRDGIYLRVTTNKSVRHWIYSGGYITADSIVSGRTLPILCSEMGKTIPDFRKEKDQLQEFDNKQQITICTLPAIPAK